MEYIDSRMPNVAQRSCIGAALHCSPTLAVQKTPGKSHKQVPVNCLLCSTYEPSLSKDPSYLHIPQPQQASSRKKNKMVVLIAFFSMLFTNIAAHLNSCMKLNKVQVIKKGMRLEKCAPISANPNSMRSLPHSYSAIHKMKKSVTALKQENRNYINITVNCIHISEKHQNCQCKKINHLKLPQKMKCNYGISCAINQLYEMHHKVHSSRCQVHN